MIKDTPDFFPGERDGMKDSQPIITTLHMYNTAVSNIPTRIESLTKILCGWHCYSYFSYWEMEAQRDSRACWALYS